MELNNNTKYISLKEASKMSDYTSDYIGFLIRNGKLSGKKVYKNISWQISLASTIKYLKKHHSSNSKKWKLLFTLKDKYISLKKASQILGYSSDYLGSLIRGGKIKGKKVYLSSSWITTRKALIEYKNGKEKEVEENRVKIKIVRPNKRKLFLKKIQDNLIFFKNKVKGELTYCNNIYNNRRVFTTVLNGTFKASLISIIIFSLVLSASPIAFLQGSIGTIFAEEEKIINFYSSVSAGDWQNPENVQSLPEVGSLGTIDSFSESNSAIYENGPLSFIIENFQSDFDTDQLNKKQIKSAKIKFSFAIGEKEADILIEQEETNGEEEIGDSENEISFWGKIKNFFKTLAIKTINLVKASLISLTKIVFIARAEGETNKGEQDIITEIRDTGEEGTEENGETEEAEEETRKSIEVEPETEEFLEGEEIGDGNVGEEQVVEKQPGGNVEEEKKQEKIGEQGQREEEKKEPMITETSEPEVRDNDKDIISVPQEDTLPNIDAKIIIWYSLDGQNWQEIDTISDYPLSNALNNGYFEYDISFLKNWEDINNLKIKFEGVVGGETNIITYLDSVWVEVNYGQQETDGQETITKTQDINEEAEEEEFEEEKIEEAEELEDLEGELEEDKKEKKEID